jgi:LPS-assembly protein
LLSAISGAIAALGSALVSAQQSGAEPIVLKRSSDLSLPPGGGAGRTLPLVLRARELRGRPDLEAVAEGDVELRRGPLVLRADRLSYDAPEDLARATGNVRIRRDGAVYSGPELELRVQRFEGFFLQPEFEFLRLKSGGRADRVDFIDSARSTAANAMYTSCPRDSPGEPDWLLKTDRVRLDFDANEGVAQGAVLRFLGVPILAAPTLSFPLTDARKSGWLPPTVNIDNRSGLQVHLPYYWNIAENRDATIVPRVITRRGLGVDAEFRYLEPGYQGQLDLEWLPQDRVADRSRSAFAFAHRGTWRDDLRYAADLLHVSDDGWWRDFPDSARATAPRLLPLTVWAERDFAVFGGAGQAYARAAHWQVLQGSDQRVQSPFQRSPQLGVQFTRPLPGAATLELETEVNRFTLPSTEADAARLPGTRWHGVGVLRRAWRQPGWWIAPQLRVNAAAYRTELPMADGRRSASRAIPSVSVDMGLELERQTFALGRALRQTLEPRLHYVNTSFREQRSLPNYDSAGKDFNFATVFSDSTFSGIDRVSDSNQIAAGVTTRLLDASSGIEALRLGVVQRYLLRTQRITPKDDGTADGAPVTQRLSDVLLLGSTSVIPGWVLDTSVQYSPEIQRTQRAIVSARYAPGEFRTLSSTYRLARGLSEQLEVGWQWPVLLRGAARVAPGGAACSGTWYTVGRLNFSIKDRRITDSVLGFEYDAGCWIGRFVAERLSTGRSEATTRLLFQLELVGLSRLGANPLKVLRDNIPGYRLLRDEVRPRRDPSPIYD